MMFFKGKRLEKEVKQKAKDWLKHSPVSLGYAVKDRKLEYALKVVPNIEVFL